MKVDLLRQLDEWGTHFEEHIDHIEIEKLVRNASETTPQEAEAKGKLVRLEKPRWRTPIRVAGAAALVLAIAFSGLSYVTTADERSLANFNLVSGEPDVVSRSENPPAAWAPATTRAPASATTRAPSTTLPPDTTTTTPPGGTTPPAGNNPANLGRDVIFTGDLVIATPDVSGAVVAARAIVQSSGGYIFGQELGGDSTVMSLKIPADFFQETLDRLSELGTVRSARVTSQDVTERIVDLESQISTAEASVERLRDLMSEAGTIDSIAKIEGELLQRETQLEQLRGQLRTMQDQVALSTIVLSIREFVPSPVLQMFVTVHNVGNGSGEECYTSSQTGIADGEEYIVCLDITNIGDVPLTDVEIDGPDAIVADLAPIQGNRLTTLPAGERYVLFTTSDAIERDRQPVTVRAIPIGEDGVRQVEQPVEVQRLLSVSIRTEAEPERDGLPSLGDALAAGWDVLSTGVNALAVAVAFVLPLLWIPLLAGLFLWWRRRRS